MRRIPEPLAVLAAAAAVLVLALATRAAIHVARSPATAVARMPTGAHAVPPQPYDGPGRFAVWSYNPDGSPVRWDPCTPIRWVVNPAGAPPSALRDLTAAFERVRAVTGLRFEHAGTTAERPGRDRSPYQPSRYGERWAPVLAAWTHPGSAALSLGESDRGLAMPVAVDGPDGAASYVSGQAVFNAETDLEPGFGTRHGSWGATMMHELGHLVGLDHVEDPGEMMFTFPHPGRVVWGPGDTAGLRRLGASAGCAEAGEPRPVQVVVSGRG